MKNPQITSKLIQMMEAEKQEKISAISCILDSYINNPLITHKYSFDQLYDLQLYELNDILSDTISELYYQELVLCSVNSLKNN